MNNVDFADLKAYLPQLLATIPAICAIIIGAFVLNFILGRGLRMLAARTSLTDQEVKPFKRIGKWLLTIAALVLITSVLGFNLGGIWTILSTILAMIAIGFVAVWSVLSNTLCTLMILIFRPFNVGDQIDLVGDNVGGRVIDLNFVFTTLRTEDGSVMQIPNNLFFQKVIKRRHGTSTVSLARQLQSDQAHA